MPYGYRLAQLLCNIDKTLNCTAVYTTVNTNQSIPRTGVSDCLFLLYHSLSIACYRNTAGELNTMEGSYIYQFQSLHNHERLITSTPSLWQGPSLQLYSEQKIISSNQQVQSLVTIQSYHNIELGKTCKLHLSCDQMTTVYGHHSPATSRFVASPSVLTGKSVLLTPKQSARYVGQP